VDNFDGMSVRPTIMDVMTRILGFVKQSLVQRTARRVTRRSQAPPARLRRFVSRGRC